MPALLLRPLVEPRIDPKRLVRAFREWRRGLQGHETRKPAPPLDAVLRERGPRHVQWNDHRRDDLWAQTASFLRNLPDRDEPYPYSRGTLKRLLNAYPFLVLFPELLEVAWGDRATSGTEAPDRAWAAVTAACDKGSVFLGTDTGRPYVTLIDEDLDVVRHALRDEDPKADAAQRAEFVTLVHASTQARVTGAPLTVRPAKVDALKKAGDKLRKKRERANLSALVIPDFGAASPVVPERLGGPPITAHNADEWRGSLRRAEVGESDAVMVHWLRSDRAVKILLAASGARPDRYVFHGARDFDAFLAARHTPFHRVLIGVKEGSEAARQLPRTQGDQPHVFPDRYGVWATPLSDPQDLSDEELAELQDGFELRMSNYGFDIAPETLRKQLPSGKGARQYATRTVDAEPSARG